MSSKGIPIVFFLNILFDKFRNFLYLLTWNCTTVMKKVSEYDHEIPQSHTRYREEEPQNNNSHETPGVMKVDIQSLPYNLMENTS